MPIRVQFSAVKSGLDVDQRIIRLATPLIAGTGADIIGGEWEIRDASAAHFIAESGHWRLAAISLPVHDSLEGLSRAIYQRLFAAMQGAQLVRAWNFVPAINATPAELENYQSFCLGRHEAYVDAFGEQAQEIYSAASAVGVDDDRLTVFALATSQAVQHLENPLQSPAYDYPAKYGPRPPSFSRASIISGDQPAVFISGTAAVRGSDSVGASVGEQLTITAENLQHIISRCEETLGQRLNTPAQGRVYVRRSSDLADVQAWLAAQPWPTTWNVVQSDICRRELLVEVELSWLGPLADFTQSDKLPS